jgi:hypothetical protein
MKSEPPISPALRLFNLIFLGLLIFAGCVRPDQTAAKDDTAAVRLTVELRDGSRVVGQGVDKTFAFHSVLLGNVELAVKDIRSIECVTTNSAKVTTTGGDVLTVGFAKTELRLQTGFGKVELPVNSIRRLTVSVLHAGAKPIDGLVALWSAEGNADDSVGNRHGQLLNQAGYAPGKIGQAFAFHNVGDQVVAPATDLPIGTSDRTIDCWIYIDSFSFNAGPYINNGYSDGFEPRRGIYSNNEPGIVGYGIPGTAGQCYGIGLKSDHRLIFSQWGDAIWGPALETGRWYNIAVTSVGNDSIKLYVDGVKVATGVLSFNTPPGSQIVIGKGNSPYNPLQFIGKIDEVAVYDRALSDDEIKSLCDDDAPARPAAEEEK